MHWQRTLAYTGYGFHGWQIQPGLVTVQGTLADALRRITGESVLPQGAGRTDAGVHALGQVCSFALQAPLPSHNLQRALNRVLPAGVRVVLAEPVPPTFHARHAARGKLYEYRIFERRRSPEPRSSPPERICSPFLAPFVWDCRWPLRLDRMRQASRHLLGTQDFSAFAAHGAPQHEDSSALTQPNPVKTIDSADWIEGDELLKFRIRGSGFLHHMVRNLVGTLVDVGRGSLEADQVPAILASRDRSEAGPTAPASGLYLVEVFFDAVPQPAVAEAAAHEVNDSDQLNELEWAR